jgi:hypothetical protein
MSRSIFCFRPSISGYQNSLSQPCYSQVRPEIVFGIGIPTTCNNPFSSTFRTLQKRWENSEKFGSCPLRCKTKGFPRVFSISAKFLWPSVAPMQLGAWRLRRCISRRAAKIESFFESRESTKHWGFASPRLAPIHAGGGGRIRTRREPK